MREILEKEGIYINSVQVHALNSYMHHILEQNKYINLTAITDKLDFIEKHIVDSLLPFASAKLVKNKFLSQILQDEKQKKILDIGTGAGFPLVPLAIYFKDFKMIFTGIDSVNKKLNVINSWMENNPTFFGDLKLIHGRLEDLGIDSLHREQYGIVLSRALANLSLLIEYSSPFIKPGGYLLAYKSSNTTSEVMEATRAAKLLKMKYKGSIEYTYGKNNYDRTLVIYEKISPISNNFPRKSGVARRSPL